MNHSYTLWPTIIYKPPQHVDVQFPSTDDTMLLDDREKFDFTKE